MGPGIDTTGGIDEGVAAALLCARSPNVGRRPRQRPEGRRPKPRASRRSPCRHNIPDDSRSSRRRRRERKARRESTITTWLPPAPYATQGQDRETAGTRAGVTDLKSRPQSWDRCVVVLVVVDVSGWAIGLAGCSVVTVRSVVVVVVT